ncbi:hypothetical protein [Spirosoma lituiforme]
MRTNEYFETMFRRRNAIGEALLNFFLLASSWPRLLLETLIRKNFGERYFSFSGALFLVAILGFFPVLKYTDLDLFPRYIYSGRAFYFFPFIGQYLTWYAFFGYFLMQAIERRNEIKRLPSVFNFGRVSVSKGEINSWFRDRKINGQYADQRMIETVLEPGLFFFIGLFLWLISQPLGVLLMICSVFYSLGHVASHHKADNAVMDKIDTIIMNEELGDVIMNAKDASEARGVSFEGRRPTDPALRRQLADSFTQPEEIIEAR